MIPALRTAQKALAAKIHQITTSRQLFNSATILTNPMRSIHHISLERAGIAETTHIAPIATPQTTTLLATASTASLARSWHQITRPAAPLSNLIQTHKARAMTVNLGPKQDFKYRSPRFSYCTSPSMDVSSIIHHSMHRTHLLTPI